jgi:ketosteroid isomerase-like protein
LRAILAMSRSQITARLVFESTTTERHMLSIARCLAILCLLASASLSVEATAQTTNVEQAILQLEREWEQAIVKNDIAALERILAPEFVSTDSDGRLTTRAEMFARRRAGAIKYTAYTQDDYKFRIVGNTAVVTGRSTMKGMRDDKDITGQERWTDVFVQRDGRWQALASHASRVAKQ